MARIFQLISRACVGLAIAALAIVVWKPTAPSPLLNISLALLIFALAASLGHHYALRSPIPVRGGARVTIEGSPVAYRIWYFSFALFCGFLLYVLLHSLL